MLLFNNISKRFSEQFVLQNFSFDLKEGDKVNIAGRSGIGKTTLFRLILGFEKPDAGTISYKGKLLNDKSVWEIRKDIAYVSQDLNIGQGCVSVFFHDTLNLKANHKHKVGADTEIKSLLAYFELPEAILEKQLEELSGGEKQRVVIINALLLKRKVFLLDEISSALDKNLKEKVLSFFLKNPEFTVLYISHDAYLPEGVELRTINLEEK
jgi:putative ABC transport system ATP-binding protein